MWRVTVCACSTNNRYLEFHFDVIEADASSSVQQTAHVPHPRRGGHSEGDLCSFGNLYEEVGRGGGGRGGRGGKGGEEERRREGGREGGRGRLSADTHTTRVATYWFV